MGLASKPQQQKQDVRPPRIGPLLIMRPWSYERAFWTSSLYKRVATDMDVVNLSIRCLEVYFVLFRSWVQVADDSLTVIQGVFCNTVLLVLLHVALRILMPPIYTRWRWVLVVHMRIYNLLSGIAILRELRGLLTRGPASPLLDYLTALPAHPTPRLATARALAMALLTFRALSQSLPPTVPLPLNAALQISFLLAVLRYMAGPVATRFSHPAHAPHVQQLCYTLASWAVPVPAPGAPLPLTAPHPLTPPLPLTAPLHHVCGTPQSAWVLSLFLPLFGGVALPLYLAYISERSLKRRFLATITPPSSPRSPPSTQPPTPTTSPTHHHLQQRPTDPPHPPSAAPTEPSTPAPSSLSHPQAPTPFCLAPATSRSRLTRLHRAALHALCIWLLAACCWVAAVSLRAPVARHLVKPLAAAAPNQVWYWQLLCGHDDPCCPAT